MNIKTKRVVLGLTSVVGLLLIPIGIYQVDSVLKTTLISVGGSIFGASLSNLFSTLGMNVYDLISKGNKIPLTTTGTDLNSFRTKYYCYYISAMAKVEHWRMSIHDYSKDYASNYLENKFKLKNDNGKEFLYRDVSLVVEKRLITILKSQNGSENPSIYFMQNFGNEYAEHILGIGIFENWDGDEMIAPMIMCKRPILGLTMEGRVKNPKIVRALNKILADKFPKTVIKC